MSKQIDLITLTNPRSPAAEAYRTLRTNLTFAALDRPIQTLVVTSIAPEEKKSLALANLAVTLAQGERQTVLVDADLRRPALHDIFGAPNTAGLTTMFVEPEAMANPPVVETGVPNLQLLPSGPLPPNPADLLGSRRMEEVIAVLNNQADMILFDAPPVIAVTDAAVLGTKVDGLLMVVIAGATRRDHAQRAQELLDRAKVRVVGSVMLDVPRDTMVGGY